MVLGACDSACPVHKELWLAAPHRKRHRGNVDRVKWTVKVALIVLAGPIEWEHDFSHYQHAVMQCHIDPRKSGHSFFGDLLT